jgi:hypothetical protein
MGVWDIEKVEKKMEEVSKAEEKKVDVEKEVKQIVESKPVLPPQKEGEEEEYDTTVVDETTGAYLKMSVRKERPIEVKAFRPEELGQRLGLKILIFGEAKTGKTTFGLNSPQPIYIIDTESGIKPLVDLHKGKEFYVYDIIIGDEKTFDIDEHATVEALRMALGDIRGKVIEYYKKTGKLATIVVDSLSVIWDVLLMWLNVEVLKAGGKINKKDVPADRRDWKKLNSFYRGLMTQLMNLPAHVVLTAQEKEIAPGDELVEGAVISRGETVQGPRVQRWTPHQVDVVLRTFVEKGSNRFFAQVWMSRYPQLKLGELIENPTINKLLDKIQKTKVDIKFGE